jgi:hypothetical protein
MPNRRNNENESTKEPYCAGESQRASSMFKMKLVPANKA